MSESKPPPVVSDRLAFYRHSKSPHSFSFTSFHYSKSHLCFHSSLILCGAIIIIIIIKFVMDALLNFKPMKRFENWRDVTEFRSLGDSPGGRI